MSGQAAGGTGEIPAEAVFQDPHVPAGGAAGRPLGAKADPHTPGGRPAEAVSHDPHGPGGRPAEAVSTSSHDPHGLSPVEADPRRRRYVFSFVALGLALLVLAGLNIAIGSVTVPPEEIVDCLIHGPTGAVNSQIVWQIRLPRLVAALVLGGALALSGFLLQTFFNNPIAGPFVLGISSGAKLTVALLMVFALGQGRSVGSASMITAAFVGALLTMGIVMALAGRVSSRSMLIVAGVMIGYICSAVTDFVITFADDASIVNLHNWSQGSFSGTAWSDVKVMTVVVVVASGLVFALAKPIGAYQLGESYAHNMGVNIRAFRLALVLLSSLLAACVTAFAGPISFVGIAVPHLVRSLLRSAKPLIVIPACFLGGAVFCLGCDLIARTAFAPSEVNISSVTAALGAPIVIFIMLRRRSEG
ncbi:MAG: iron ABC transporter permease [Propionibacteriaceae bacterium]|jgi:iron complex transport system permease protein|nr:iron ABC transporter permease [Propionibacteriaceae bacterium]